MPENNPSSSSTPLALVAVGLIKPSWTHLSFAITLDVATDEVCGIGVHADPEMARVHAIFDTVRDNGWCVSHGRPSAFASYCDRSLDADKVAAAMCGSKLRYHVSEGAELIEFATKSLANHLAAKGETFEKLYCETIMWAILRNQLPSANPAWDWWEMHENAGELPPFLAALELPVFGFASSQPAGRIEFEGQVYQHPWLETFTQQALPYHLNYSACRFLGNDAELWVIDEGKCFAATKVLAAEVTTKVEMPAP